MALLLFHQGWEEEEHQNVQELNQILIQGLLHHIEESILVMIVMTLIKIEVHIEIAGPLKEEGPKVIMEDHLKKDTTQIEDILGEIIQVKLEDSLMMEDPLMVEDPLMTEDPLIIEDPQEVDDMLDTLEDEDLKDLLDL